MEVKAPTSVDVGAIDGAFTEMNDEQNKDKLIGLAGAYVTTLTTTGNEMTEDQKNLQMRMTDSVSRWNYTPFHQHYLYQHQKPQVLHENQGS